MISFDNACIYFHLGKWAVFGSNKLQCFVHSDCVWLAPSRKCIRHSIHGGLARFPLLQ